MKYRTTTKMMATIVSMIVCLLVISTPALAHHGTGVSYDMNTLRTLKGTVTEFRFANPHAQLYVDVKDETGKVVRWVFEGSSVYFWTRDGYNRNTVKPGEEITVAYFPSKAGTPVGVLSKVIKADGKEVLQFQRADGRGGPGGE